jgi:FKBP-type peptidyl-prolyl cis-trans isomerase
MKQLLYLISAVLVFALTSCSSDNSVDEVWRDANIQAYNSITKNSSYKELKTESGPSGVYYKVFKSGEGDEHPLQTSKVKVLYKGSYYDGSVFDNGSSLNGIPVEFSITSTVRGFSFAVQNMVVGDHWEIWIPYYLGYGYSDYTDPSTYQVLVKGYTTLVFNVELISITQYP